MKILSNDKYESLLNRISNMNDILTNRNNQIETLRASQPVPEKPTFVVTVETRKENKVIEIKADTFIATNASTADFYNTKTVNVSIGRDAYIPSNTQEVVAHICNILSVIKK
jgi:hypothetical protein